MFGRASIALVAGAGAGTGGVGPGVFGVEFYKQGVFVFEEFAFVYVSRLCLCCC